MPRPLSFAPCFLIVALWASTAVATEPGDQAYLTDLLRRASEAKLWEERDWRLLLHYRENLWGGYTSEADDPGFFLAPNGKIDPQAELEATLSKFFSTDLAGRSRQPAQCAFIARYQWLKDKLAFDDRRLPPQPCERFQAWLEGLNAESVTMIFPAAFLNNPASMFGHTLLRLDQKGQTEQTRILAYTMNYAADVPADVGIEYAYRGIFGGYRGYFSTIPYYLKVQEYGDIENRDIWEYRLNFSDGQVRRMLMHAWELGNAYFDYFFFKENCAYHLLSLLEVADPNLDLRSQFFVWTVPADTVRLLTRQSGLVGDIAYRPSRSTQIKRKRALLPVEEQDWIVRIAKDASLVQSEEFARLPTERQAFVLDVVSDYLRYRSITDEDDAPLYKERNRTVLIARSGLKVKTEPVGIEPFAQRPDLGHKTSRAGLGFGWRNDHLFEELSIRAGYHDLLDPEIGYTPDAQIELLALRLRHYQENDQFRVEQFTLANIVSLSPMDALFKSPSWKINASMQSVVPTRNNAGCRYCSVGVVNGGIGAALESRLVGREVYFAFGELEADIGHAYDENYRMGGGGTAGLLADLTERWKVLLSTTYIRYPLGDQSDDWRVSFGQRYTLQRNLTARFEFNHRHDDNEVMFSVQAFF